MIRAAGVSRRSTAPRAAVALATLIGPMQAAAQPGPQETLPEKRDIFYNNAARFLGLEAPATEPRP